MFHVNAAHNVVHLLSGAVALVASSGEAASRTFFRVLGFAVRSEPQGPRPIGPASPTG